MSQTPTACRPDPLIRRRGFLTLGRSLLLAATWLWPLGLSAAAVPPEDLQRMQDAAPTAPTLKPTGPRRLLVFTLAKGYIHEATPWGVEALRLLGERTGAYAATAAGSASASL